MFDFLFRWRKASKCNKLIETVKYRLNVLKDQRSYIVRNLRDQVVQRFKIAEYQLALDIVEQIAKDECMMVVYEILAKFCDDISTQLSNIGRNKDCSDDIKEAISSLIFASARFGQLPELLCIRKLFTERYGKCFETMALEGHHVNFRIRENLSMNKVTDEVKNKLFEDITRNVVQCDDDTAADEEETRVYMYENIEEFQSPLDDMLNGTDQRCFVFLYSKFSYSTNNYNTTLHHGKESRKRPDHQNHALVGLGTRRAMSMPCERPSTKCEEESGVKRSYSFPAPSPPHVHPKLPDYDDILALSTTLKEENYIFI